MNLFIEPLAMEYIKKQGGVIHLAYRTAGDSCCEGKGILMPDVFLGKPMRESGNCEMKDISGISLYYGNEIKDLEGLTIKLESFLGIKKLSITGLEPKQK